MVYRDLNICIRVSCNL